MYFEINAGSVMSAITLWEAFKQVAQGNIKSPTSGLKKYKSKEDDALAEITKLEGRLALNTEGAVR